MLVYKLKKFKLNLIYWIRLCWMKFWFLIGFLVSLIGISVCIPIVLFLSSIHHLSAAIAVLEIKQLRGIMETSIKVTEALNSRLEADQE